MDRRTFIKAAAAAGLGAAALSTPPVSAASGPVNLALPSLRSGRRRAGTPVEHIVVLMQENRSVDHYLGWYGAENDRFDAHQHAAFPDLRQGPDGPLVETELGGAKGATITPAVGSETRRTAGPAVASSATAAPAMAGSIPAPATTSSPCRTTTPPTYPYGHS